MTDFPIAAGVSKDLRKAPTWALKSHRAAFVRNETIQGAEVSFAALGSQGIVTASKSKTTRWAAPDDHDELQIGLKPDAEKLNAQQLGEWRLSSSNFAICKIDFDN